VQVEFTCAREGAFETEQEREEWDETLSLYLRWAMRVKQDNFHVATLNKKLKVEQPWGTLASIYGSVECPAALAIEMLGEGISSRDCAQGVIWWVDWGALLVMRLRTIFAG
jgi:hypothetical protein